MASTLFYPHEEYHQQTHFLEACSGCQKPLGHNRDIFMYRGNTAFCSDECRQEQIEMDEAEERSRRRREQRKAASAAGKKSTASGSSVSAADSKPAVRVA
ncbi:hypothetical protein V2J09_018988 [Rumex salicifolius]